MISHRWYDEVPADVAGELHELIQEAAAYDAEAGFSTADPLAAPPAGATIHHLLVSMPPKGSRGSAELDALPDVRVVAYLRLDVLDGVGDAQFVVRREFRSLGVATLLIENLRDQADGWAAVPGLRQVCGWSHGGHPAAERLSWRFGARPAQTVFKTLCLLGGRSPYSPPEGLEVPTSGPVDEVPEVAPGHDAAMAPADRAGRSRLERSLRLASGARALVGRIGAADPSLPAPIHLGHVDDKDDVTALLATALVDAQESGARVAQMYVASADEVALHVSRELGFFHDQSDVLFAIRLPS